MSDSEHREIMDRLNRLEAKLQAMLIVFVVLGGGLLGWAEYQWAEPHWGSLWAGIADGLTFALLAGWAGWMFDKAR